MIAKQRRYSSRRMSKPNRDKMLMRIAEELLEMIEARRPTEFERARAHKTVADMAKAIIAIKGEPPC